MEALERAIRSRWRWGLRIVLALAVVAIFSMAALAVVAVMVARQIGAAFVAQIAIAAGVYAMALSLLASIAFGLFAISLLQTPLLLLPFSPVVRVLRLGAAILLRTWLMQ